MARGASVGAPGDGGLVAEDGVRGDGDPVAGEGAVVRAVVRDGDGGGELLEALEETAGGGVVLLG
jgi:hypothetical protein